MTDTTNSRRGAIVAIALASLLTTAAHSAQCNFSEMGGTLIDFGIVSAANNNNIVGTENIEFTCSDPLAPTISYTVAISAGSSGDFASRSLQHAGNTVNYNLYREPTYTEVFGDGQPGSNSFTVSSFCVNGLSCVVPVYGRIDGGQSLSEGQFTDEVVVTITF